MYHSGPNPEPSKIVRAFLATGSIVFAVIGFFLEDGTRFFAASGALSVMWLLWDVAVDQVFVPLEYWIEDMVAGRALPKGDSSRWSVYDRIRLLEDRFENGTTRRMRVHAAIRLSEIFELQLKDPDRAREVIETAKEQFPEAPTWKSYDAARARKRKR